MLVPVILSGGAGTRLWPVSRSAYPKPFMRMGDGESLLNKTLDRALRVADGGQVLTVTGRDYYFLTRDEYAQHRHADLDKLPFLLEPAARNTAPAIVLAALHARERVGADAMLLILPADHLIRDLDAFVADATRAAALANDGWLVTFGIRPTHPETGFGYIRMGDAIDGRAGRAVARVRRKAGHADRGELCRVRRLRLEFRHVLFPRRCVDRSGRRRVSRRAQGRAGVPRAARSTTTVRSNSHARRSLPSRTSRSTTRSWNARRKSRSCRPRSTGATSDRGRR